MRVLITDGEQRAALALVRSVGAAGQQPFVVAARTPCLGGASRYAVAQARVPEPVQEPDAFADEVARLVRTWQVDMVLPTTEAALLSLLPVRDRIQACIPWPSADVVRAVSDKRRVLAEAAALEIAVPAQVKLADAAEAAATDLGGLRYPVVLKPARSVGEFGGVRSKLGVSFATDAAQLRDRIGKLPPAAFPLLVQQRVVGPGMGVFLLIWKDAVLATFAHRRLREKPPSGGVSVYSESVAPDACLVTASVRLLANLGWQGVAMVEFKLDAATGTPYLMEINGRFWGSLQLAITAGVDFPQLLLRAARGDPVEPVTSYRTGVRNRWWWGDVDQLIAWLKSSADQRALFQGAPTRARAVLEFLKVRPGVDHNEVFRWSDPMPLVRESWDWLRRQ